MTSTDAAARRAAAVAEPAFPAPRGVAAPTAQPSDSAPYDVAPYDADGAAGAPAGGVLLRLGHSRFSVPMADVAEVTALPRVSRLPGAPPWLLGIANWRGRILPVLDLRVLVGVPVTPLASSARLVVLTDGVTGALTAGVVAEAVPGVNDLPLEALTPPPATLSPDAARLVAGQLTDARGPIAVLDVAAVLALRDRVDRRRRAS